jgi:hypothetical protein
MPLSAPRSRAGCDNCTKGVPIALTLRRLHRVVSPLRGILTTWLGGGSGEFGLEGAELIFRWQNGAAAATLSPQINQVYSAFDSSRSPLLRAQGRKGIARLARACACRCIFCFCRKAATYRPPGVARPPGWLPSRYSPGIPFGEGLPLKYVVPKSFQPEVGTTDCGCKEHPPVSHKG